MLESPQLIGNLIPKAIDTLDFSGVRGDMHITVVPLIDPTRVPNTELTFGPGTNLVVATSFDPGEFTDFQTFWDNAIESLDEKRKDAHDFLSELFIASFFSKLADVESELSLNGGIVVANDIESIIGSKGTTYVHFHSKDGAPDPIFQGRITGEDVVFDYSRVAAGVTADLGVSQFVFDPLEWDEKISDGAEFREGKGLLNILARFVPHAEGHWGSADLVGGDRLIGIEGMLHAWGLENVPGFEQVIDFIENTAVVNVTDILGTSASDTLTGSQVPNVLIGYGGNDTISGGTQDEEEDPQDVFAFGPLELESDSVVRFDEPVTVDRTTGRGWESAGWASTSTISDATISQDGLSFQISHDGIFGSFKLGIRIQGKTYETGWIPADESDDDMTAAIAAASHNGTPLSSLGTPNAVRNSYGAWTITLPAAIQSVASENQLIGSRTTAVVKSQPATTFANIESVGGGQGSDLLIGNFDLIDGSEEDYSYVVSDEWGHDVIFDLTGENEIDFSFTTAAIAREQVSALIKLDQTAGTVTIEGTGTTRTLTVDADQGSFVFGVGENLSAPLAFDATLSQLEDALNGLTIRTGVELESGINFNLSLAQGSLDGEGSYTLQLSGDLSSSDFDSVRVLYSEHDSVFYHYASIEADEGYGGSYRLLAIGDFTDTGGTVTAGTYDDGTQHSFTRDDPSNSSAFLGASNDPSVTDQMALRDGLNSFATWVGNIGSTIDASIDAARALPIGGLEAATVLSSLEGVGTTAERVGETIWNAFVRCPDGGIRCGSCRKRSHHGHHS